ncbi:hypothetical protein [Stenotrophomonas sp. PS02300]|uniref:hypothetical protein n=1 Tax=Stenotrophomonas sp. PS02300 TaxID=2991426 RepID=UPI00249AAF4E|nr:hypothetical protein [Stenotrophomonas sp. PS02300]
MKKQVYLRVKVDPGLRRAFQLSAWRSERSPAYVLRSLIQNCVSLDRNLNGLDIEVWGDSFPLENEAASRPNRQRQR